jgi:hypothetical protein
LAPQEQKLVAGQDGDGNRVQLNSLRVKRDDTISNLRVENARYPCTVPGRVDHSQIYWQRRASCVVVDGRLVLRTRRQLQRLAIYRRLLRCRYSLFSCPCAVVHGDPCRAMAERYDHVDAGTDPASTKIRRDEDEMESKLALSRGAFDLHQLKAASTWTTPGPSSMEKARDVYPELWS